MIEKKNFYINGKWVSPSKPNDYEVINPSNEEPYAIISLGTKEDVDLAVKAAKEAFQGWSEIALEERLSYIEGLAAKLGERSAEIGELISQEVGMPGKMSIMIQACLPAATTASVSGTAREFPFEETIGRSLVTREPVGVVGCITPWNYPLHQIMAKVAPAMAMGCTVILKPSVICSLRCF